MKMPKKRDNPIAKEITKEVWNEVIKKLGVFSPSYKELEGAIKKGYEKSLRKKVKSRKKRTKISP